MAHFAKVNNGIVQQVIVAEPEFFDTFVDSSPGTWLQTSYNHNFRNQYAGWLDLYIPDRDVFVSPQPYPSWTLNNNHRWQAPTPMPEEDGFWIWNETEQVWER